MLQADLLHDFSCFLPLASFFLRQSQQGKGKGQGHIHTHQNNSREMHIATCAVPSRAVIAPC